MHIHLSYLQPLCIYSLHRKQNLWGKLERKKQWCFTKKRKQPNLSIHIKRRGKRIQNHINCKVCWDCWFLRHVEINFSLLCKAADITILETCLWPFKNLLHGHREYCYCPRDCVSKLLLYQLLNEVALKLTNDNAVAGNNLLLLRLLFIAIAQMFISTCA